MGMKVSVISLFLSAAGAITLQQLEAIRAGGAAACVKATAPATGCVLEGSTTTCTGCSLAQTAACVSNGAGGCVFENTTTACTGCSLALTAECVKATAPATGCVLKGSTTVCTGCSLGQTGNCVTATAPATGCVIENTTTVCTGCSLAQTSPACVSNGAGGCVL